MIRIKMHQCTQHLFEYRYLLSLVRQTCQLPSNLKWETRFTVNSDRCNGLSSNRPFHETNKKRAQGSTGSARAEIHRKNFLSIVIPATTTVAWGKITRVTTNVGYKLSIISSVVHSVIKWWWGFDSQYPSSSGHSKAERQFRKRFNWSVHFMSTERMITQLISPSSVNSSTRFVDTYTAVSLQSRVRPGRWHCSGTTQANDP